MAGAEPLERAVRKAPCAKLEQSESTRRNFLPQNEDRQKCMFHATTLVLF